MGGGSCVCLLAVVAAWGHRRHRGAVLPLLIVGLLVWAVSGSSARVA